MQKGSAPIFVLIGVFILAGLAAAFYFGKNYFKTSAPTATNSAAIKQTSISDKTTLKIPELGIQFTSSKELDDIVYKNEDGGGTVRFSSKELIEAESKVNKGINYCTAEHGPLITIAKISRLEAAAIKDYDFLARLTGETKTDPPTAKDFGDYFIYYVTPQATCSENSNVVSLQSKKTSLLETIFPSMELIK